MSRGWIAPLAVLAMFAVTLAAWESLPERVPTHWGVSGEPDAWGSRGTLFILPMTGVFLWGVFTVLPRVGPRQANLERTRETWWLVANVALLMLLALQLVVLGASLGWNIDASRIMLAVTGIFLAVIGNYLPRMRPNWWMGIRTPWTLENDEVWRETHRVGGRWMLGGGILAAGAALLPAPLNFYLFMTIVMLAALVPVVYSYVLWRRLGGDAAGRSS